VRIALAGETFEVGPDENLNDDERRWLARFAAAPGGAPALGLEVAEGSATPGLASGVPAEVDLVESGRLRVRHAAFQAELDPGSRSGWLRRVRGAAYPLEITLRVALCARLPLAGGLPLHAAGLVVDGWGGVFFGVSGAGKSTLASLSPHPVLSDELVAVLGGPGFGLAATGFWGELERDELRRGRFPLGALVELAKGPAFRWERVAPEAAFRRLVHVALVPPAPRLWTEALGVVGRLVREVPVYRMEWTPQAPPWDEIARAIRPA
jgi:hypothetical protein